jgi:hypothetical protein
MPKFTLKVDYAVTLGNPRKRESMTVAPGQTVEVPGEVVTSRAPGSGLPPLPEDAYIVADAGEERAWPQALWSLVEADKPAAKAPAVKES